ncbi:MAG: YjbQ family protein [Candidatus Diapherotrites archaeon]|nr:YjbQ family protein [Candidatus Diapherotrites archaeon]
MVKRKVLTVSTRKRVDVLDITESARLFVEEIGAEAGLLNVFVPHTTAGVILNEAEAGLLEDLKELLERLVPELHPYAHNKIDNNAHAHLRTILLGSSVVIPVEAGRLSLGTWQRILLIESDGPRSRHVILTYVGL